MLPAQQQRLVCVLQKQMPGVPFVCCTMLPCNCCSTAAAGLRRPCWPVQSVSTASSAQLLSINIHDGPVAVPSLLLLHNSSPAATYMTVVLPPLPPAG